MICTIIFTLFYPISNSLTWSDNKTPTSGSHRWLTVTLSVCACRRKITGFTHLKCLTSCAWLSNKCGCQHLQSATSRDWIGFDRGDEYRKSVKRHVDNVNEIHAGTRELLITFMHLADAFIQSNLHSGYTFLSVCVFPGNWTHNLLCY